jgi:hypothetical protein
MRTFFLIVMTLSFNFSTEAQEKQQIHYTNLTVLKRLVSTDSVQYSYKVYQLPNQTYGYVIFADGEKYLHQSHMPGKDMNIGFGSKADAEAVAKLILVKLKYPVVPPSVSTAEMKHFGIN